MQQLASLTLGFPIILLATLVGSMINSNYRQIMDDNEEAVAGGGSVESFTKLSKEGQLPKIKS